MASGLFRDMVKAFSPPWLIGPVDTTQSPPAGVGERFMYTLALAWDALMEHLRQGMLAHMPGQGPPDSLPPLGSDRAIIRGAAEPDANYASRVSMAFDTWHYAGAAWNLLSQLIAYAFPAIPLMRTVSNAPGVSVWDSMSSSGFSLATWQHVKALDGNWNWDSVYTNWWRGWIVIYAGSYLTKDGRWGDGKKWGDGRTWGTSATRAQIKSLRQIAAQWKPQHAYVVNIIISFDNTLFNPFAAAGDASLPNGTWGKWGKVTGADYVPSRNANARFLEAVI